MGSLSSVGACRGFMGLRLVTPLKVLVFFSWIPAGFSLHLRLRLLVCQGWAETTVPNVFFFFIFSFFHMLSSKERFSLGHDMS